MFIMLVEKTRLPDKPGHFLGYFLPLNSYELQSCEGIYNQRYSREAWIYFTKSRADSLEDIFKL